MINKEEASVNWTTSGSAIVVVAIALAGMAATPAHAQAKRTFVSALSGNDANDCSRPTPCRTFAGALGKTAAGGVIDVLDPGGYSSVTINKSISIVADGGGDAGILVSAGSTGITISAGLGDKIILRGLTIEGAGGGDTGIRFWSGQSLIIENCVVRNHTGTGIAFQPNGGTAADLQVSNTMAAHNGIYGIMIFPSGAGLALKATLNQVKMYSNDSAGLRVSGLTSASGTINVTVLDSVAASNAGDGLGVDSAVAGGATANLMVARTGVLNNHSFGVQAYGSLATARVRESIITGNGTGVAIASGGTLLSYKDNSIDANGTDGSSAQISLK